MSWDDEDFQVPSVAQNDFIDEEDGLLESWDQESEEEDNAPKAPVRNRVGAEQRQAEREAKEREILEKKAMSAKEEDAKARKERLKQVELDNDLKMSSSLFGSEVDAHPRSRAKKEETAAAAGPTKLSDLAVFKATTKSEFETLRKTLVPILADLNNVSSTQYANFVTELSRDLCKPISRDSLNKVTSTLTALGNEKLREERANRGKKKKPQIKEVSLKVDQAKDTTNYQQEDFDDDDFM